VETLCLSIPKQELTMVRKSQPLFRSQLTHSLAHHRLDRKWG
jgi:hypothetical protein